MNEDRNTPPSQTGDTPRSLDGIRSPRRTGYTENSAREVKRSDLSSFDRLVEREGNGGVSEVSVEPSKPLTDSSDALTEDAVNSSGMDSKPEADFVSTDLADQTTSLDSTDSSANESEPKVSISGLDDDSAPPPPPIVYLGEDRAPQSMVMPTSGNKVELTVEDLNLDDLNQEEEKSEEQSRGELHAAMKDALVPKEDEQEEKDIPINLPPPTVMKRSIGEKIKEAYFAWWDNRIARYLTLILFLAVILVFSFVPIVRNWGMNLVGVRSSVSVQAVDQTNLMPLENVTLKAGGVQTLTDVNGVAKLQNIKLGKQVVTVSKAGFKDYKKTIDFGMRTQDLGEVNLVATGEQFEIVLKDFLSGKTLSDISVVSGEASARSDKNGMAILTIPPMSQATVVEAKVDHPDYKIAQIELKIGQRAGYELTLVPRQRVVVIDNSSGKIDLFKVYVDGEDRKLLLAGTGSEDLASTSVISDPEGRYAALVSKRSGKQTEDGYALRALTIVDIETGDNETIEHAADIKMLGWRGSTVIYWTEVAGASAANPDRQKIMSYDSLASKRNTIASANDFVYTTLQKDSIFYATSSTDPSTKPGFFEIKVDASGKKSVFNQEVWSVVRSDYKTFNLQTPDKWFAYVLGQKVNEIKPSQAPLGRQFIDSPNDKYSVYVNKTVSTGDITAFDLASGKETVLASEGVGVRVLYWLSSKVLVAEDSGGELLVVSVDGGKPTTIK